MDVALLIDAIFRQTTVLTAQLATAAGGRAPLAHTANQVFVDVVRELKDQGIGNKVIADMFGMALRTYHAKVRRLAESTTVRGRSLWAAVLEYLQDSETVLQAEVLHRFRRDDESTVRAVLSDLVDSGMVFKTGRGTRTTYRAARPDECALAEEESGDGPVNLVWVAVNRFGPAEAQAISEVVPLEASTLSAALDQLVNDGRVSRAEREGRVEYSCDQCVIPLDSPRGWEAAVFDHYQAVVTAISTKLRAGINASADETIGGSTYGFVVWEGHPHREEVLGLLALLRRQSAELRAKVTEYNTRHPNRPEVTTRGQRLPRRGQLSLRRVHEAMLDWGRLCLARLSCRMRQPFTLVELRLVPSFGRLRGALHGLFRVSARLRVPSRCVLPENIRQFHRRGRITELRRRRSGERWTRRRRSCLGWLRTERQWRSQLHPGSPRKLCGRFCTPSHGAVRGLALPA